MLGVGVGHSPDDAQVALLGGGEDEVAPHAVENQVIGHDVGGIAQYHFGQTTFQVRVESHGAVTLGFRHFGYQIVDFLHLLGRFRA